MKKIVFGNGLEQEIANISQVGNILAIVIENAAVDEVIATFKNRAENTAVIRYYAGIDLIQGYAGYTKLTGIEYKPDIVKEIDYNIVDPYTGSGFAEEKVDICTVHLEKGQSNEVSLNIFNKVADHDNEISILKSDMGELEKTILGEEV